MALKNKLILQPLNHEKTAKEGEESKDREALQKKAIFRAHKLDKQGKPLATHFKNLSTLKKLDFSKLKDFFIDEFEDFGIMLFQRFENSFSHIGNGVDYYFFSESLEKIINWSSENLKKLFFYILDQNKDGKVCEADLFGIMKIMKKEKFFLLLNDDICEVLKELDNKRIRMGKDDDYKLTLT